MRKRKVLLFLGPLILCALVLLIAGLLYGFPTAEKEEPKPEVVSLLGKKLYATPAQGDELAKLEEGLRESLQSVEKDPESVENIIRYGRALAGLWRYHEAIEVYSKGIKVYPDQAMLYRHRGHRYISIREFEKAETDLAKAAELNDSDFDIWYHLGLAHYLQGEFDKAFLAYQSCLKAAEDDDARVAVSNWLFNIASRLGRKEDTDKVLGDVGQAMKVEENTSYFNLLLFYKGLKSEDEIVSWAATSDLDAATVGYGLGCWHLANGRPDKARAYFEKIVSTPYWPAFGYIAAEAELFRMASIQR